MSPPSPPSVPERPVLPGRLTRSEDFQRVQGGGRRQRTAHLLLLYTRGAEAFSRVGLTVSRKVGNAVRRNRIKRWLREAVRSIGAPARGPWDLVLIPRAEAGDAGFHQLRAEVAELFARVAR